MQRSELRAFHELYVQGIKPGELVVPEVHHITNLTQEVAEALDTPVLKIHIRSIALKHIYEKRNAYDYDIILDNLSIIVRYPDRAYKNTDTKQSDYIVAKYLCDEWYIATIKLNAHPEVGQEVTMVISAFKTNERYLKKFELIQSWKGGIPSS